VTLRSGRQEGAPSHYPYLVIIASFKERSTRDFHRREPGPESGGLARTGGSIRKTGGVMPVTSLTKGN
jgi:hypothetical protein